MNNIFMLFYSGVKTNNCVKIGDLELNISDFVANGSFADLKNNVEILDEPSYAYFIRNTDLKNQSFEKYVNEHTYHFLSKSALFGDEVLISNVGDVGSVFLCPKLDKYMTLGNNMIYLNSISEIYYNYYLYFLFNSEEGQYLLRGITGGSAQPKFNKTDFKRVEIHLPTKEDLVNFNETIIPYLQKVDGCRKEIKILQHAKNLYLKKFFG